jgi:CHAT domain-containing protein
MYLIGDSSLYIFVGTHDSSFAKEVAIPRKKLEKMIFDFYNKLKMPDFEEGRIDTVRGNKLLVDPSNINRQDFYGLSSELYHILIDPVFQEIESKSKLAIIPNGAIYYIPFQALLKINEDKIRYLGLDFTVFYSNKLSYITAFYYDDATELSMLAIGNSDSSLHYAEIEVKNLKNIYDRVEILLREEATKKSVFEKSGNYSVIHFATHGILDYNDYENSYLVLASDMVSGDDGHLKISEIYRINNIDNCNMVTLSACETALSLEMLEGWPITTASAFLNIGVPSVIASLWKIDDKATSILMEKFYANLKSMNKADAIRNAQLHLAADPRYSHPYYWAPFLLVGSWK